METQPLSPADSGTGSGNVSPIKPKVSLDEFAQQFKLTSDETKELKKLAKGSDDDPLLVIKELVPIAEQLRVQMHAILATHGKMLKPDQSVYFFKESADLDIARTAIRNQIPDVCHFAEANRVAFIAAGVNFQQQFPGFVPRLIKNFTGTVFTSVTVANYKMNPDYDFFEF